MTDHSQSSLDKFNLAFRCCSFELFFRLCIFSLSCALVFRWRIYIFCFVRPTEVKLHRSRQLKTSLANHVGFMLSALCVLLSKGDGAEVTANSSVLSRLSCSSALSDPLSETCFHEFGHTKVLLSQCNGDLCSNPVCTDVLKAIRTLQTFKPAQF